MENAAEKPCYAAAQLEGRALAPRAAPEQMGKHRAYEYQRGHALFNRLTVYCGLKNGVCAPVVLHAAGAVHEYYDKAAYGQQAEEPRVCKPQLLRKIHGVVECGAYKAQRHAYDGRPQQPLEEYEGIAQPCVHRKVEYPPIVMLVIHKNTPFVLIDDGYIIPSIDRGI